ncbi:MAG: DNA helicase UvrD [uncultured Campylobacterales bacterium]|uniref:DNA 3'-5' helicase n=1 Tax=uncultured Campylobacterales bacterium TaxID=352960 RepID=A0A6S6TAZ7_9BACT|nr:MAG: DNA helicase UvrD [uncultured Campylobacterales bacterium]
MIDKFLALGASAGSGKTFALAIRYIALLYMGANPSRVLTLTFTNKAANEMRERISNILSDLENKELELSVLSKTLGVSTKELLAKKNDIYNKFLKSDIKISTIDSFVSSILRKFSFYFGINPDFEVDFSIDEEELKKIFIKNIKKSNKYKSLIKFLSVIEENSMFEIFDNLYAYDFVYDEDEVENSNTDYKKNFYRIKEHFLNCEGLSNSAKKALNDNEILELLNKTWMSKDSLKEYSYFKKCHNEQVDVYFAELKKDFLEYLLGYEKNVFKKIFEFYEIYLQSKLEYSKRYNKLSFDDMSYFVSKLMLENINKEFFYFRLDARIDHILLDEYQDTSFKQFEILKPLISEIISGFGASEFKTFFYVGDVKQSIYRFRGANSLIFDYTKDLFRVNLNNLDTNYRSSKGVVEFVNKVFETKIKDYIPQIADQTKSGYIEYISDEDIKENVLKSLKSLLDKGAAHSDIAVLVENNKEAKELQEYITDKIKNISIATEPNIVLSKSKSVKPVVEYLKYIYFKEMIHKTNFNALIGEEFDYKKEFEYTESITDNIKKIIQVYELSVDDNLLKFIEFSYSFDDFEELLFNIESISQKEIFDSSNKIKILTIHKSKGLEFDHVIIMDSLSSRIPSNRKKILYKYDGIRLEKIFFKIKGRGNVDSEYNNATQLEKQNEYIDKLNKYYVAFTRAKNSLIICAKKEKSNFDFLEIDDFSLGNIEVKQKQETKKLEFEYESKFYGLQNVKKDNKSDREVKNLDKINFGTSLHYMLEMMGDLNPENLKSASNAMSNRFCNILSDLALEDISKRVKNLVLNKEFINLIKDAKIYKEYPIYDNTSVSYIDLLIEKDDEVIILDYKTGIFSDKYTNQLSNYKNLFKSKTSKKIITKLCFINKDQIKIINT